MLRTNQAVGSRELYGDEAGACVIIPARMPTTRIPFGYVQFEMRIRFAGRIQPGVANSSIPTSELTSQQLRDLLQDKLLSEANDLST